MNRLLVTSNYSLLVIVLTVFLSLSSVQVYAETDLNAREIMEKVDEESRKSSDSAFTRMKPVSYTHLTLPTKRIV